MAGKWVSEAEQPASLFEYFLYTGFWWLFGWYWVFYQQGLPCKYIDRALKKNIVWDLHLTFCITSARKETLRVICCPMPGSLSTQMLSTQKLELDESLGLFTWATPGRNKEWVGLVEWHEFRFEKTKETVQAEKSATLDSWLIFCRRY